MFPTLFSIGPFSLQTMSLFAILAFLATSLVFWKRGREEHYKEDQLFDGFLLAILVGVIAARVGHVIFHWEEFGTAVLSYFDVFGHPGMHGLTGLVFGSLYLHRYAKNNKWDVFEIMDFWVTAVSFGAFFIFLGKFFEGSGVGSATNLPVGIRFPGLLEPHHPVQLYFATFFLVLYLYLSWVEYQYRTFEWYRAGKKTAQTGYLSSVFVIASGLFALIMSFLKQPTLQLWSLSLDSVLFLGVFAYGLLLLYVRSGRTIPFSRERKKRKAMMERLNRIPDVESKKT